MFGKPKVTPEYEGSKELKETVYNATNLSEDAEFNASKLFGELISSGRDPKGVALEATILGKQYPNLKSFAPGGDIWSAIMEQNFAPKTTKEVIDSANRNFMSVLGRGMTPEEQSYVDKERPTEQQLAGLLYANPSSNFAKSVTPDEEQSEAYYGRLMPRKDKDTGAVGFTGERYGLKINPIAYKGA